MAGFLRKIGTRIAGALFEKAIEQRIPVLVPADERVDRAMTRGTSGIPTAAEVTEDGSGATQPAEIPVVRANISAWSAKGILRSRTVWVAIVFLVYSFVVKPFVGIDIPIMEVAGVIMEGDTLPGIVTSIMMAVFRVKATTLTRG